MRESYVHAKKKKQVKALKPVLSALGFRIPNGCKGFTICFLSKDNAEKDDGGHAVGRITSVGVAFCSKFDQYSRPTGRFHALRRAADAFPDGSIPPNIKADIIAKLGRWDPNPDETFSESVDSASQE